MLCAISGEAPQVPVASRKSGNVFEKRLIEAHIAEHHTDPVTGEDLEIDDLIELKTQRTQRPRPPTLTSIPSLLSSLQNEWDAIALETFELQKQLALTRQELSTALYQNDAASRVIARLMKERDDARDMLSKINLGRTGASNGDAMQVDNQELPEELAEKVDATQTSLMSTRRKRPIPEDWATGEEIESFDSVEATDPLCPGGQSLAVNSTGDLVVLGGADGAAGIYSISQKEIVHTIKTQGTITAALWCQNKVILGTSTGSVKVYEEGKEAVDLGSHAGPTTALSLHPCGEILASIGADRSYKLYDLNEMKVVSQIFSETELTCGGFHPDGHLIAAGTAEGQIKLWETKTGTEAASFDASGSIRAIAFSENGIWLASAVEGLSSVDIWDLRKANVIKTLDVGSAVESLAWEFTGQFLAVAGPGSLSVQQYSKSSKAWSEPLRKAVPAKAVQWGPDAKSLITLSTDGALNILGST